MGEKPLTSGIRSVECGRGVRVKKKHGENRFSNSVATGENRLKGVEDLRAIFATARESKIISKEKTKKKKSQIS